MSTRVEIDGRVVAVKGGVQLSFSADGIGCAFVLDATDTFTPRAWVEVFYGSRRAFAGRIRHAPVNLATGVRQVQCVDCRGLLGEVTYYGRSAQTNDLAKRHAHVKYGYCPSDLSAAGYNVYWTVGSILQDVLNNAGTDFGSQGLPTLAEVIPAVVYALWRDSAYGTWDDATLAQLRLWAATFVPTATSTSLWAGLTLHPNGHEYDGAKVADVLTEILCSYYPARNWWIDPQTLLIAPYATYDEDPAELRVGRNGLCLRELVPLTDMCYSRVIIEGQNSSKQNLATYLAGFLAQQDGFHGGTAIVYSEDPKGWLKETTTEYSACDSETLKATGMVSYRQWPLPGGSGLPTPPASTAYYIKDVRWRSCDGAGAPDASTMHSGGAYDEHGVERTLTLVDNEVGILVFKGMNDDGTAPLFEDRKDAGYLYATELHKMLSDVRWGGAMHVEGDPFINPLQRLKIKGVPVYGDITCLPSQVTWDSNTGLRQYTLGDAKYNPLAELKLRQRLGLRDKEVNSARAGARNAMRSRARVLR
ncbi:MAG: hypothetical protein NTV22_11365 [bacterium]|nr:hypothetical protein [bacterium]